jgi:hypothetical protein
MNFEKEKDNSKCQLCLSENSLIQILDLGEQPICNAVLSEEVLDATESFYPLKLYICENCYLLQLKDVIPAKTVFCTDYNYLSGTTTALVAYFQTLAARIISQFNVKNSDFVCDIGSNDGTFLGGFRNFKINVIGVEPTPIPAKMANDKGILTVQEFFKESVGKQLAVKYGCMKVVTAMNVLAHNNDVHSFLNGVSELMNEDSIFISQSHYLGALIEKLEYDTVYHEHLRYYSLKTLKTLFDMHGLHLFHAELNEIYGGSILCFCSKKEFPMSKDTQKILKEEIKYQSLSTYLDFGQKVRVNGEALLKLLTKLKGDGNRIVGIGAPMKSSTLLNYCHVGPNILDYLAEVNPLKIGKYLPGVHIPIVDEKTLYDSPPDYAMILSWNVSKDIIANLRKNGYHGKFIVPIPQPKIIN